MATGKTPDKPLALNPTSSQVVEGDEGDDEGATEFNADLQRVQVEAADREKMATANDAELTAEAAERMKTPVGTPEDDPDKEAQRLQAIKDASTTIPGGAYIVNGQLVDANGEPVRGKARAAKG